MIQPNLMAGSAGTRPGVGRKSLYSDSVEVTRLPIATDSAVADFASAFTSKNCIQDKQGADAEGGRG